MGPVQKNQTSSAKPGAERLKRSRRPALNYLEMGIPEGATLLYQDGETTCTVLDGRHVQFKGESCSLSAITAELMGQPGRPIRGPSYWSYNGRNLAELYEETYSQVD